MVGMRRFKLNIAIQRALRSVAVDVQEATVTVSYHYIEVDIQADTSYSHYTYWLLRVLGGRYRRCYPLSVKCHLLVPPQIRVGKHRGSH
jgi:hypothetical protein